MKEKKIMIIDDDSATVDALEKLFVDVGYKVISAFTGETGLNKVIEEKPDVVILDIKLPDMDGLQVCGKIKEEQCIKDIPVVMLTGYDTDKNFDESIRKKADWYMVKPYSVNYMLKIVDRLLKGE